jgi:hypothetical protein
MGGGFGGMGGSMGGGAGLSPGTMGATGAAAGGGGFDIMGMLGGMMGGSKGGGQQNSQRTANDLFNMAVSNYTYGLVNFGQGEDRSPPPTPSLPPFPGRLAPMNQNVYEPLRLIFGG